MHEYISHSIPLKRAWGCSRRTSHPAKRQGRQRAQPGDARARRPQSTSSAGGGVRGVRLRGEIGSANSATMGDWRLLTQLGRSQGCAGGRAGSSPLRVVEIN